MVPYSAMVDIYRKNGKIYSTSQLFFPNNLKPAKAHTLLNLPLGRLDCRLIFTHNKKPDGSKGLWSAFSCQNHCFFEHYERQDLEQEGWSKNKTVLIMCSLRPNSIQHNPGVHVFSNYEAAIDFAINLVPTWQAPFPYVLAISENKPRGDSHPVVIFPRPLESIKVHQQIIREIFLSV